MYVEKEKASKAEGERIKRGKLKKFKKAKNLVQRSKPAK